MQIRAGLALSLVAVVFAAAACGSEFGSETPGAAGMSSGGTGGVNVGGSGAASDGGTGATTSGGSGGTPSGGEAGVGNTGGGNTGGSAGDGGTAGAEPDASTGGAPNEDGGKDATVCLECNAFEKPACCSCIPNECPVAYDTCRCHPDCAAYIGCRVQCGGSLSCINSCKSAFPGGVAKGDDFLYCSDQAGCACN
jgi:hypothetical protein